MQGLCAGSGLSVCVDQQENKSNFIWDGRSQGMRLGRALQVTPRSGFGFYSEGDGSYVGFYMDKSLDVT